MRHYVRLILLLGAALWIAVSVAQEGDTAASDSARGLLPLEELRTFTRVYDHIRSSYVEEISDAQLLEYAIKGMLSELDPHSSYLDTQAYGNLQIHTSGEFGGLGIEVGMENGFVRVIAPIDDTPAYHGGVQAGDLIIRLDDTPVKGMTLNEAIQMMRGPKGSKITLTIVRDGVDQPFELELERDIIQVRSVRIRPIQDDYLYIRIAQFQVNTGRDMSRQLTEQLRANPDTKGIILDLRNNPGGVLQASVEVADAFLDGGLVVYTEGRMPNSEIRYRASAGDVTGGLPLVVLINDGSASASEIVAGALQDNDRALLLGTRTFGKGSVQSVIPITDDRAIKLTTALYLTPGGRSIQAQGIVPDVTVERARVTAIPSRARPTEADLARHLTSGDDTAGSRSQRQRESDASTSLLQEDNQLYEAVNLLRGLNIFRQQQARLTQLADQGESKSRGDSGNSQRH